LAFNSRPEHTGIRTNILSASDNLGNSIVELEDLKLVPTQRVNAYSVLKTCRFWLKKAYLTRAPQTNLIVFDLVVANLNQHW
jgi:hypothetical protein